MWRGSPALNAVAERADSFRYGIDAQRCAPVQGQAASACNGRRRAVLDVSARVQAFS